MIEYLSTLGFSASWLDELAASAPGVRIDQRSAVTAEEIPAARWAEVEVLHTSSAIPDPQLAPRLRWIQLDTAGIDHLAGHPVWDAERIQVTTIGGISPVPMAEYVLMMVLAHAHHLPELLAGQGRREWPSPAERWNRYLPSELAGSTMVIVGHGRIGRRIAELARAVGISVIGVTRTGGGPTGDGERIVAVSELDDVIGLADQLVVVTPLTEATRGLIDARRLALVRPGALLVDVGRGGVVDEAAVLAALDDGRLSRAVLDVFATEPLPAEHPLWTHPRAVLTPHVSGFAPAYAREVQQLLAENLRRFAAGEPLLNRVDGARGY